MRAENNPLDLNNLPDDFSRDGNKPVFEAGSSSSAAGCISSRKKKNSGKEDCEKVYECRFCSLKFCKSQALGGHMNRHRQERETEAMNRARQMVFGTDHNLPPLPHLGCQSLAGAYPPLPGIGDPFRSLYPPPRLYSGASSPAAASLHQPPQQPPQPAYLYPASASRLVSYPSQLHSSSIPHHPVNDYYMGHVLGSSGTTTNGTAYTYGSGSGGHESNYMCIGAPVQDPPLPINRFQDHGF